MKFQDYYETLGVSRTASQEEIRRAYKKLARKYHPDLNKEKGAEDKFKQINEAHEVLGSPETREKYDRLGANWKAGQDFQPPPDWAEMFGQFGQGGSFEHSFAGGRGGGGAAFSFSSGGFGGSGFSDFFEALFGGGGHAGQGGFGSQFGSEQGEFTQAQSARAPGVEEAEIEIGVDEAINGSTRSLSLERTEYDQAGRPGRERKSFQVKIPPLTADGTKIRLAGQGSMRRGSNVRNDVLLKAKVVAREPYRIVGGDLVTSIKVTPSEAALGAKVEVELPDGRVMLSIPAGSSSGTKLRLKGKGLPLRDKSRGTAIAEIKIVVPQQCSAEERDLYQKLAEISKFKPRGS